MIYDCYFRGGCQQVSEKHGARPHRPPPGRDCRGAGKDYDNDNDDDDDDDDDDDNYDDDDDYRWGSKWTRS